MSCPSQRPSLTSLTHPEAYRRHRVSCYSCHERLVVTPFTLSAEEDRTYSSAYARTATSQVLTIDSESGHSWIGTRAFVFYPSPVAFAFDYATQLLPSTIPSPTSQHLPTRRSATITTHRARENSCLAEERNG